MQPPQLETKGQQNKRIVQQNGKQSPQLRAKVIQRKQQIVKQSPQLESVQSETKGHQIKEMGKQGDMQYRQSGNVQNEHQPDNSKYQPQLVNSSCQDSSVATSQVMQYPQSEDTLKEHSQIIANINCNWLILHTWTTLGTTLLLLLKICSLHS